MNKELLKKLDELKQKDAEVCKNLEELKGKEYTRLIVALANLMNFNMMVVSVTLEGDQSMTDANYVVVAGVIAAITKFGHFKINEVMADLVMVGKLRSLGAKELGDLTRRRS